MPVVVEKKRSATAASPTRAWAASVVSAFLVTILLTAACEAAPTSTILRSTCLRPIPVTPSEGPGCGVPPFVDVAEFGNNAHSIGLLVAKPTSRGFKIRIELHNLPRPDLVITAWIIWRLPMDPTNPSIFKFASHASPLSASTGAFTSGLGREPNKFRRKANNRAVLSVKLDFNPTYPNEGPLTCKTYAFQSKVPGIQDTELRQYKIPNSGGRYLPSSNDFLRKYNRKTGFEELDAAGKPQLVRSPVAAMAVAVVAHVDKMTHGIAPGFLGVDHYELMSFLLPQSVGSPMRS